MVEGYKIKFVANYLRKSRGEQDNDLEKHRTILTDLCSKYNFKYVEYAEIGSSDSIDMRPKMLQLLGDVENGIYDAVCVVDYDRLGRGDLGEQDRIKKAFQNSETLIITPEKIYDLNNDLDDTYADFKGLFARQEYKMITKRLRQGKRIGARRGDWTNGRPPFPYEYERYRDKYNPKGLVVNDDKRIIYRKIIDMALDGFSTIQIASSLNRENISSPKGKNWSNVTVSRLLVDETHLGKIISNKSQGDGHRNKKSNAKPFKRIPRSEWIVVENCHEVVKTLAEHSKILQFIHERDKVPHRARRRSLSLSGLVKCKKCGHFMTFIYREPEVYLRPCWYKDAYGNKCNNRGIKYDVLEKLIIEEIKKYKDDFVLKNHNDDSYTLEKIKREILEQEKLILRLKSAIEKLNDAYEMGDYSREEWLQRKEKRQREITKVQDVLYNLNVQLKGFESVKFEDRLTRIESCLENINELTTPEQRNKLFSTIISEVIWCREEINASVEIKYK